VTSALVTAVLSAGIATAAEARGPSNIGVRFAQPPQHLVVATRLPAAPHYVGVVERLPPKPVFKQPTWGTVDCRLPDCRVHHGPVSPASGSVSGGDPGGGQGGGGGGGGDGGGGGHLCMGDRDCGPLRQD
jgi:uncharacterized membrane protein YgcG